MCRGRHPVGSLASTSVWAIGTLKVPRQHPQSSRVSSGDVPSVGVRLFVLRLNRRTIESKGGSRRKESPRVRRMRIDGKKPDNMVGRELFQVAEQLDEHLLFDHPEITEQISGHAVASGSPDDVTAVLREVI